LAFSFLVSFSFLRYIASIEATPDDFFQVFTGHYVVAFRWMFSWLLVTDIFSFSFRLHIWLFAIFFFHDIVLFSL